MRNLLPCEVFFTLIDEYTVIENNFVVCCIITLPWVTCGYSVCSFGASYLINYWYDVNEEASQCSDRESETGCGVR